MNSTDDYYAVHFSKINKYYSMEIISISQNSKCESLYVLKAKVMGL